MKLPISFGAWLLTIAAAVGASLHTAEHYFGGENREIFHYESFLGQTVFQEPSPSAADLSFYVMPSFRPQYAVWLTSTGEGFRVVTRRTLRDLWSMVPEWGKLTQQELVTLATQVNVAKLIESSTRPLGKAKGEQVLREWRRLLVEGRIGDRGFGADGATAVFRTYLSDEERAISRDAWSPKPGTPGRKLWEIGDALAAFARGENESAIDKALALPAKDPPENPVARPE